MRGEHSWSLLSRRPRMGSSPLARGARDGRRDAGEKLGIIPACAGSTSGQTTTASRTTDHPRLRGEHGVVGLRLGDIEGSSPLARGALRAGPLERIVGGIIPACAGSTSHPQLERLAGRDHPRLRGEHLWHRRYYGVGEGSSPLARGALFVAYDSKRRAGIIPACAGSTIW